LDPVQDRYRLPLTQRLAIGRCQFPRAIFDVVKLPDPLENLIRLARRIRARIEELPARVRPAGHFLDLPVGTKEDPVVTAVCISLEKTLISLKKAAGPSRPRLMVKS
jgi:hypothetical protein